MLVTASHTQMGSTTNKPDGANQCEALVTEQCCNVTLTSNTATGNTDLQAASPSPGDLPVSIKSHTAHKNQLLAGSLCTEEIANHLYHLIKIVKKKDVKNLQWEIATKMSRYKTDIKEKNTSVTDQK